MRFIHDNIHEINQKTHLFTCIHSFDIQSCFQGNKTNIYSKPIISEEIFLWLYYLKSIYMGILRYYVTKKDTNDIFI